MGLIQLVVGLLVQTSLFISLPTLDRSCTLTEMILQSSGATAEARLANESACPFRSLLVWSTCTFLNS